MQLLVAIMISHYFIKAFIPLWIVLDIRKMYYNFNNFSCLRKKNPPDNHAQSWGFGTRCEWGNVWFVEMLRKSCLGGFHTPIGFRLYCLNFSFFKNWIWREHWKKSCKINAAYSTWRKVTDKHCFWYSIKWNKDVHLPLFSWFVVINCSCTRFIERNLTKENELLVILHSNGYYLSTESQVQPFINTIIERDLTNWFWNDICSETELCSHVISALSLGNTTYSSVFFSELVNPFIQSNFSRDCRGNNWS